ncbi:MAG: alpha/beta fold hydrolase [Bacteroidota bacterium]
MSRPVLLVPGFLDSPACFHRLGPRLEQAGFSTIPVRLTPRLATCSLRRFAGQVAEAAAPFPEVDVVGFSMGGLVSRLWVQRMNGSEKVRRLVTLASPHRGSHMARAMPQTAAREMRPGSDLLNDLEQDAEVLEQVQFASLWTPYDLTVLPGASGDIGAGSEQVDVKLHRLMLYDEGVAGRVIELLRETA